MGRKKIKMPCEEKTGKQRRLCFATDEFKDFSKIRKRESREMNTKLNSMDDDLDGIGIIGPNSDSIGASLFV